jgi:hypothetical protein
MTTDSSIWGAVTSSAAHPELAAVTAPFGNVTAGVQAPESVSPAAFAKLQREGDRLESTFVSDVFAARPMSEAVREHYCVWFSLHPALAKTISARHGAFASSLGCKPQ